jgi:long-chain acyl-CoA synthetase
VQFGEREVSVIEPVSRGRSPFGELGVERDAEGVARYVGRPPSLVAMLRVSVERDAAATALVEVGGASISYGELWRRAARVAGGLALAGVDRGERVALRLANGIDWVLAFFGAQLLGAVVVPVNTRFTEEEAAYVIEDSGASYTFAPGAALPDGEPVAGAELGPEDLAAIFYTSGTTGFPKGAMTSHGNFMTNSENAFRCLFAERSEGPSISTLVSVPLFHVTGCNSQLIPVIELGGRVEILSGPLDFEGFFRAVGVHGVNQLVSVPAIYHAVVNHPQFADGGAPIAESLVQRLKDAFPQARVGNGFGLTETSSLTSFLPHEEAEAHADSVGFAMPVVDLALDEMDPDTGVG